MIDGFTCEIDANRTRAEAERRAARERLIRTGRLDAQTRGNRDGESRTAGSYFARLQLAVLTALIRLRTVVPA